MTYKTEDGRCICKEENATLTPSTEGSSAYSNQCYTGFLSNDEFLYDSSQIKIYPNPTNAILNFELPEEFLNENSKVNIYSTEGKLIRSETIKSSIWQIDFSTLSKGVYFATFQLNDTYRNIRFIKE